MSDEELERGRKNENERERGRDKESERETIDHISTAILADPDGVNIFISLLI